MSLQNITQLLPSSFLTDSSLTKTLGEEFVLCDNGNMVFHWADFFETCDVIKAKLESTPELMEDFKQREGNLKRLALIPVWIKTERKVHQTTMHDLYERYILNHNHLLSGVDSFCPIELSFISGTGPFKEMSIAECFNTSTYKDFILVYLLKDKLPKRDFRIRLKSKILLEYGHEFKEAHLVSLEQITMNGLLLSSDSETYMKKISHSQEMRFLINTQMLQEGKGKNLRELQSHLSQYAFNLLYSSKKEDAIPCALEDFSVQSSFDFSKNKKVFLFIPYEKLNKGNAQGVAAIKGFIGQTKDLVRQHYQDGEELKTTA